MTDIEAELDALRVLIRRLLCSFDEVATAAGARYFLAAGTALGLVREGKLLSWDADADVLVPVADLPSLTQALRQHLPPDLEVMTVDRGGYEYTFPRVGIRGVHHSVLHLDLFPLAPAPRHRITQVAFQRTARLLTRLHFLKHLDLSTRDFYSGRKRAVARVGRLLLAPMPRALPLWLMTSLMTLQDPDSPCLANPAGTRGMSDVYCADWFEAVRLVTLDGRSFPVPGQVEAYLAGLYGDYQVPPSQSAREAELAHTVQFVLPHLREAGLLR